MVVGGGGGGGGGRLLEKTMKNQCTGRKNNKKEKGENCTKDLV